MAVATTPATATDEQQPQAQVGVHAELRDGEQSPVPFSTAE